VHIEAMCTQFGRKDLQLSDPQSADHVSAGVHRIDAKLVVAARRGQSDAVAELWTRAYPRVLRLLAHLTGNRELSKDLTQETLLLASQRLGQLRSDETFEPWLLRIARHVYESARHQPRFRTSFSLDWILEDPSNEHTLGSQRDPIETYPEREEVWHVYARLSVTAREIIYLSHVAGYSGKEIADILDISSSAVYQRLHRAEIEFRRVYDQLANVPDRTISEAPQWEY
jgi:RNA polymerase sigma-70 factor (ECF subfamily)